MFCFVVSCDDMVTLQCFDPVSKMTYTVSSGMLNSTIPYHCWLGYRKGIWPVKTGYWFVGGDDLTGALHIL